jgi:tripartite ATP-independent transporter DctP family solute receptor
MMLKKFRCLALVMALILVFVFGTTFAAKKPLKLVYGSLTAKDHFYAKGDLYFKKLVEKNSKGQILVDCYYAGQLGTEEEQLQAAKSGAQHLILTSWGKLQQWMPKVITFELPYLFRDEAHILKVVKKLDSLINPKELAAKTGIRVIGARLASPRQVTTKFPVNLIEDLKGHKLRAPSNKMQVALIQSWGAIPTVLPAADTYTALATGTIEGQENPFDSIYAWKFHEQTKYCALTGHMRVFYLHAISDKCWKSLTRAQRKLITDAADKTTKMMVNASRESETNYYNLLKKEGMIFTKPDVAPFKEKAKSIWSQFGDVKLIKKIEAIK